MVAERDAGEAALGGVAVEHAAAQPGAEPAHRLSLGQHALDDAVGVLLDGLEGDPARGEVFGEHLVGEPGLLLVEVDRDDLEIHGCVASEGRQHLHHHVGVLAARHAGHHAVAVVDHAVVRDGLAREPSDTSLETLHVLGPCPVVRGRRTAAPWRPPPGSRGTPSPSGATTAFIRSRNPSRRGVERTVLLDVAEMRAVFEHHELRARNAFVDESRCRRRGAGVVLTDDDQGGQGD